MEAKVIASKISHVPQKAIERAEFVGALEVTLANGQQQSYSSAQLAELGFEFAVIVRPMVDASKGDVTALRAQNGEFVSPKKQDADGVPEIIHHGKSKR
jgi:hypothetical protein